MEEGVGINSIYNIAFVNSERWLAKSRVDITPYNAVKVLCAIL